jgi:hypothetical protein
LHDSVVDVMDKAPMPVQSALKFKNCKRVWSRIFKIWEFWPEVVAFEHV